jgi:RNA polymerase sigma-70 factor (ECF subfamily)
MPEEPVSPTLPAEDARRREFQEKALPLLDEVYGVALRMTKNPDAAQDLVAEAYARAWKNLAQFQPGTNIRAWLYRIMTNAYINNYRRDRREPEKVAMDAYDKAEEFQLFNHVKGQTPSATGDPVRSVIGRLTNEAFNKALENLPEEYRAAVALYDIQGLSYQDVAGALDVPLGTVRSRLARGRKLLQRALWKHAVDAGLVEARP